MKKFCFLFVLLFWAHSLVYSQTASLQVVHNAADPALDTVDVYLNGNLWLDDFAFQTATPFGDASSGVTLNIGFAPDTSTSVTDTLKNYQVTLMDGETYVVIASGVLEPDKFAPNPEGRDIELNLFVKPMARKVAENNTMVELFPFHGATDLPAVNIMARDVGTLVENAVYGDILDYVPVPPAVYTIDITVGEDSTIASFAMDITLLAGISGVGVGSGFLNPAANQNGSAFTLLAVLSNGMVISLPTIPLVVSENSPGLPVKFELLQNYPNPFNPETEVQFILPEACHVTLKIFNNLGQEIRTVVNNHYLPGYHRARWDSKDNDGNLVASGIYLYQLKAGNFSQVKKLNLLR